MKQQLNTCIVDRLCVEAALLNHPLIDDCVVLVREKDTSGQELVAYVVSAGLSKEQLQSYLRDVLPPAMIPDAYIPVSTVPLTESGQIDEQALIELEALDSELIQRWEQRLESLPDIEQVAVIVEDYNEKIPPLHLSDLLPFVKSRGVIKSLYSEKAGKLPEVSSDAVTVQQKSISYGAASELETNAPSTLSAALLRTALLVKDKGILYIKADGSEIVQSYEALLNEAQRIKGGLCQLGLKPGDKVIFQINQNWDFIPAFWGCILGGFVPVPISTAPTYEPNNSTVQKLYNAWQMLDKPIILTTAELASKVRSLSNFLSVENFQVETVDRLRLCEPDKNCHVSQPDDLAILILTSGSTGIPKGVMLSHRNILSNVAASARMNNFTSDDISLNWLNLDHVGSLIRCSIRDIYVGSQQIHGSAEVVLEDPLRWLDWIDRYRVTFAWAPNFALGLVNARKEVIQQRRWDFSAVKSILSVAEVIVPKTARLFWELLAPHSLSINAMHSAWGMSETCAAVCFSHKYLLNLPSPDYPFVEVGVPIPGFKMRIVDKHNQVVNENIIGELQISGEMITCGYYQNPELSLEAFTEDGWLKTGDLAYIHQGRLTITGRQKDVIIINGLNHYSHEIEAIVELVEKVEVSYTAAFAVRDKESDTDKLALVFHTSLTEDNELVHLVKEIRRNIVREIGVNPDYLIPVKKEAIPKTAIGKIQRSKLKQQFDNGKFTEIIKQIDIKCANDNTLPDWFYKKIWRRQEAVTLNTKIPTGCFLVFLDQLGLGLHLCAELKQKQVHSICIEAGTEFVQFDSKRYSIDPKNPEHYQRLLKSLLAENLEISQILHLWTYDKYKGEISSLEALEQAQERGVYSLLFLVQALSQIAEGSNIRLSVISSHTQPTEAGEEIAYENSPILGMIKTIPQELPWLDCRHIDLTGEVEADTKCLLREIQVMQKEREVAYRNQQRLVCRLSKVDMIHQQTQDLPFQYGGMYLITGGLGEIGIEIAKYLLQHYQARLLLVGRTPLPKKSTWLEYISQQEDAISTRIQAYLSLEQLGGEVIYEAADICNLTQLEQVVDRAKSNWQCELEGVIHLAGIGGERLLVEETRVSLASTLRPKVFGTWVLHQLLEQQNKGVFISFSSVISFFGAFSVGAYAAANNFLDSFSHYQRAKSKLQSYCFGSSTWAGVGISRGYEYRDARFAQGRQVMSPLQGLNSFLACLHHQPAHLLVGLDGNHPYIRQCLESTSCYAQKLCAYFTASVPNVNEAKLRNLKVCDRFGTRSKSKFRQLEEMPLSLTGEIDRKQLATGLVPTEYVAPRNEIEEKLINIWQQVLNVSQVGIQDNFFELGGTSLLAVRLFSNIEHTFGKRIPLSSLFSSGTVEALAQIISSTLTNDKSKTWSSLVEIQPKGSKQPLFCIHPLGGETLCYRNLAKHLGLEQPVYGLQPIGLDGKEPPHTKIEDMALHYIQEIQSIQPNGPYFLLGWSFGGFVAYEMAQQFHSMGQKVAFLGILDACRPGYNKRSSAWKRVYLHIKYVVQGGLPYLRRKLAGWREWGTYQFQERYKHHLQVVQGISDDKQLKVIDANALAASQYIFQTYPGSATLLRTLDENRDEAVGVEYDPLFGWGDIVEKLDIHYIPGSHIDIMEEPQVQVIAEQLKVCLEKSVQSYGKTGEDPHPTRISIPQECPSHKNLSVMCGIN